MENEGKRKVNVAGRRSEMESEGEDQPVNWRTGQHSLDRRSEELPDEFE